MEPTMALTMMSPWPIAAMKPVVVRRSRVGAMPSRSCSARALIVLNTWPGSARDPACKCVHHHGSNIEPELLVEFTDSCRTRDVDLGHEAADDVDADEYHAAFGENRPDLRDQPAITVGQFPSYTLRARREIAAVVVGGGNAGERVGDWLAVDDQDPGIAGLDDVRHVTLRDGEALPVVGQRLDDDVEVLVALLGHEDGLAAHAVERLHDDLSVFFGERRHLAGIARDERGRAALRKPRRE